MKPLDAGLMLVSIFALVFSGVIYFSDWFSNSNQLQREGSLLQIPSSQECDIGAPGDRAVVGVLREFQLRALPKMEAAKIMNKKASEITRQVQLHQIDNSTTVRVLCKEGDWREVEIVTPDWLSFVSGWVPSGVLREIKYDNLGKRVFVHQDFSWYSDINNHSDLIVKMVNKTIREIQECSEVDPHSVAMSTTKSKLNDPVFFVTCNVSSTPFNVWFRSDGFVQ